MKDSITVDDIFKAVEDIRKFAPPVQHNPFNLYGMPVYVAQDHITPKIQVSNAFAEKWLTDEAKERINAKLLSMLGSRVVEAIPRDKIFMVGNSLIMRPEQMAIISGCVA